MVHREWVLRVGRDRPSAPFPGIFEKQALKVMRRSLMFWEGEGKGNPWGEAAKGPRLLHVSPWGGLGGWSIFSGGSLWTPESRDSSQPSPS